MRIKLVPWMFAAFLVCIAGMLATHWKQVGDLNSTAAISEAQWQRKAQAQDLVFEMESYRSTSANFRRMYAVDIAAAKARLKTHLQDGLDWLEKNEASTEDRAIVAQIRNRFAEFLVLGAKIEPLLYSRNIFQNSDIQEMQSDILEMLGRLSAHATANSESARAIATHSAARATKLMVGAAGGSVLLFLLLVVSTYYAHSRPLRLLKRRLAEARKGRPAEKTGGRLKGLYGEVVKLIDDFQATLEAHRRDRLDFVTAVASDLRPPLLSVRAAADLISTSGDRLAADPKLRFRTVEATRKSLFRVSAVLEGLNDLMDLDATHMKIDDQIVDVGRLIQQVSSMLGGPGSPHEVIATVPPIPVWASVDRERIERVVIYLVSKLIALTPQGGKIMISVSEPNPESAEELRISIYDSSPTANGSSTSSGPEQDLLRHWATQRGFGMSMADKIMKAHGGSVTASGVAGTRVLFKIRIPKERVAIGLISSALAAYRNQPKIEDLNRSPEDIAVPTEGPGSHPMN